MSNDLLLKASSGTSFRAIIPEAWTASTPLMAATILGKEVCRGEIGTVRRLEQHWQVVFYQELTNEQSGAAGNIFMIENPGNGNIFW